VLPQCVGVKALVRETGRPELTRQAAAALCRRMDPLRRFKSSDGPLAQVPPLQLQTGPSS
jgi:hypothetical protein